MRGPLDYIQLCVRFPQSPTQHLFPCPAVTPKLSQALFSLLVLLGLSCLVKYLSGAVAPRNLFKGGTALGSLHGAPSCCHGGSSATL